MNIRTLVRTVGRRIYGEIARVRLHSTPCANPLPANLDEPPDALPTMIDLDMYLDLHRS